MTGARVFGLGLVLVGGLGGCAGPFRSAPPLPDTAPNAEVTPAASAQLSLAKEGRTGPAGPNHRQYYDKKHKRYYYFDPERKLYFWEDGSPK